MKNALSRIHISEQHKAFLGGILLEFAHLTPPKEDEKPCYEVKPVKAREITIDPEEAKRIEADSWAITQTLTESYASEQEESITIGGEKEKIESDYVADLRKVERPLAEAADNEFWELAASLTPEEDMLISIILYHGKDEGRKHAVSLGCFFEAMVASCNEKALDTIGDGVMEPSGEIFEEYRKEMLEVFPEPKGEKG